MYNKHNYVNIPFAFNVVILILFITITWARSTLHQGLLSFAVRLQAFCSLLVLPSTATNDFPPSASSVLCEVLLPNAMFLPKVVQIRFLWSRQVQVTPILSPDS